MLLYVAIAAAVLTSDAAVARGGAAAWCPTLHTIQGNDPSAPFLADDGTWHVFVTCTSSGNWQHYISRDLMRWAVLTPTGFDAVTGSVGSADGQNLVAFWGNTSKPFPCCDIQASAPASASNANLTSWRPLGRTIARPHNLSLHQGFRDPLRPLKLRGKWRMGVGSGSGADQTTPLEGRVHWFTAQDETLTTWSDSGKFFAVPQTNGYVSPATMAYNASWNRTLDQIECPDVFELGDKVVVLASLQFDGPWQGTSTSWFVGSVDATGTRFEAEQQGLLDYGQLYAGKSGTTLAAAPGDRRVLFAFTGYPSPTLPTVCASLPGAYHGMYHVFPRILTLGADSRLALAPVAELETLRAKTQAANVSVTNASATTGAVLATGSQLDVAVRCSFEAKGEEGEGRRSGAPTEGQLALSVLGDTAGAELLLVGYDFAQQLLFVDHAQIGNATIQQTAPLPRDRLRLGGEGGEGGEGPVFLRIVLDNAMVESFCSSAVAITSFVSPPGATAPAARSLRVAAAPHGLRCALSAWTLSL